MPAKKTTQDTPASEASEAEQPGSGGFTSHPIVLPISLPKYRPGEGAASSEASFATESALANLALQPSYEQLRDSATGDAKAAWDAADSQVSNLRAFYEQLREDERYNDEYKAAEAWKRYEAVKGKIAASKQKAKEELHKQAKTGERFSIPMPPEQGLVTNDTQKILAAQNEAARIVRKLDRLGDASDAKGLSNVFGPDKRRVLREEYGQGLEVGGVAGGCVCRAVLSVCDELGIDRDSVVDGFRKERHRESLERAQHVLRLTDLISSGGAPEPPFPKPGQRGRGSESPRRNTTFLVDRDQTPIVHGTRKRRPNWR